MLGSNCVLIGSIAPVGGRVSGSIVDLGGNSVMGGVVGIVLGFKVSIVVALVVGLVVGSNVILALEVCWIIELVTGEETSSFNGGKTVSIVSGVSLTETSATERGIP